MAPDQEAQTAGRDRAGGLRRTAITGVGVVAPGDDPRGILGTDHRGTDRDAADHGVRSRGLSVTDRRGGRLRPDRRRPHRARAAAPGPLYPVRHGGCARGGRGLGWSSSSPRPTARRVSADVHARADESRSDRGQPGLGGRRNDRARERVRRRLEPGPGMARRPRLRAPVPVRGPHSSSSRARSPTSSGPRARRWSSPRAAHRDSTRSGTGTR